MAELKTRENDGDVDAFLSSIESDTRRHDAIAVKETMETLTGDAPRMWGTSIVGFGRRSYRTKSGSESEWFKVGFSPRKQALTLYIIDGFDEYQSLLGRLGPHSTGKSCLYIRDLAKVDTGVLEDIISLSLESVASENG